MMTFRRYTPILTSPTRTWPRFRNEAPAGGHQDIVRHTVHFSGRVQGVGFRYTALKVAAKHKAAGFVRNLPDGRVEMVLEGNAEDLYACVADLAQRMARYIEHQALTPSPATGEFGDPAYGAIKVVG